jgi:NlpC/P60 family
MLLATSLAMLGFRATIRHNKNCNRWRKFVRLSDPEKPYNPKTKDRTKWWIGNSLLLVILAVTVTSACLPYAMSVLRLLTLGGVFCLWAGVLMLYWNKIWVRVLALVPAVFLAVILALPERKVDTNALRQTYVASLKSYQETPYVWGGEHKWGMDCSGLMRRGFIDAMLTEGVRQKEPGLLRSALILWWNDASARAMGEEHQGKTWKIGTAKSLNTADYSVLKPGDMAVTQGGQHILAYVGDEDGKQTWIQASPLTWKVSENTIPEQKDGYFGMEAVFIRWSRLP